MPCTQFLAMTSFICRGQGICPPVLFKWFSACARTCACVDGRRALHLHHTRALRLRILPTLSQSGPHLQAIQAPFLGGWGRAGGGVSSTSRLLSIVAVASLRQPTERRGGTATSHRWPRVVCLHAGFDGLHSIVMPLQQPGR